MPLIIRSQMEAYQRAPPVNASRSSLRCAPLRPLRGDSSCARRCSGGVGSEGMSLILTTPPAGLPREWTYDHSGSGSFYDKRFGCYPDDPGIGEGGWKDISSLKCHISCPNLTDTSGQLATNPVLTFKAFY